MCPKLAMGFWVPLHSYTLSSKADWRQGCPWMSKTLVPASVLRPDTVTPDCMPSAELLRRPGLNSSRSHRR